MSVTLGVSAEVKAYVQRWGVRELAVLARCRRETEANPRAMMQISPEQGALMQVLVRALRARRVIEVGVFTGYSSTAVGQVLREMHGADAELVACDISSEVVDIARGYWKEAQLDEIIAARVAPAGDSLAALLDEGRAGDFDIMFIDADKTGYRTYYDLGLALLRPGGTILIDNMLWSGAVADPADVSADTVALRELAAYIHADPRVDMTLATVGDGLSVIVKR